MIEVLGTKRSLAMDLIGETLANILRCNRCRRTYYGKKQLVKRDIEGSEDYEVGLLCPHCGRWARICYLNDGLDRTARRMTSLASRHGMNDAKAKRAGEAYRRKFKALQEKHGLST